MDTVKILFVDDEPDLCQLMKLTLEQNPRYEVTTAGSGEEGLQKARATCFDLVITDFRMPGMDGAAMIRALKAIRPHAPVVICSVYHDDPKTIPADVHRAADGLIRKPLDHDELERTIQDVLSRSGA